MYTYIFHYIKNDKEWHGAEANANLTYERTQNDPKPDLRIDYP